MIFKDLVFDLTKVFKHVRITLALTKEGVCY